VAAAKYARENSVPYLGICLGMQTAVIEYARNVMGMADATSTEFNAATPQPVVVFMPEGSKTHMGGTMRLGLRRTILQVKPTSLAHGPWVRVRAKVRVWVTGVCECMINPLTLTLTYLVRVVNCRR